MAARFLADPGVYNVFKSRRYVDIMRKFDAIFEYHYLGGVDDPDLILDCHALSVEIDKEIVIIHNFIRDNYLRSESLELDPLVNHPVDFARLVKKIGHDNPTTLVSDLEGLGLPSEFIVVFSNWRLRKAIDACDGALALDSAKKKVLDFVESRIGFVAPNLCAFIGAALAVKLMAAAGGLSSLAKMLKRDVLRLGAKREGNLAQFCYGEGYIEQSEIIQSTPPSSRRLASEFVAHNCRSAAYSDSTRQYPSGQHGTFLREEILKELEEELEEWQGE